MGTHIEVIKTDLTAITGKSPMFTSVEIVKERGYFEWIVCGETCLNRTGTDRKWTIGAYLDKATDGDHDTAYAFRFTLIGVEFEFMSSGTSHFVGWIASDEHASENSDDQFGTFRVPRNGEYDPLRMKGAQKCDRCKGSDKHMFVPDGFYLPPFDRELYEAVKGKQLRIATGPK